jgi:hypothetical protein
MLRGDGSHRFEGTRIVRVIEYPAVIENVNEKLLRESGRSQLRLGGHAAAPRRVGCGCPSGQASPILFSTYFAILSPNGSSSSKRKSSNITHLPWPNT